MNKYAVFLFPQWLSTARANALASLLVCSDRAATTVLYVGNSFGNGDIFQGIYIVLCPLDLSSS